MVTLREILAGLAMVLSLQTGALAQKDQEPLQGSYAVVDMVEGGMQLSAADIKAMTVIWKDDRITVKKKKIEDEIASGFDIQLLPGQTIDFTVNLGEEKGKKMLGIYRIKGDTVTLCFDEDGRLRPSEFVSPPRSAITLVVLKKIK
jgi:uncharacterized protein (TIGR03067 family)